MSLSPGEPAATPGRAQSAPPAPGAPAPLRPPGLFGGLGRGFGGGSAGGTGRVPTRGRIPLRLVVGVVCALFIVVTASHIGPAVKAGLHDGTRGQWIATTRKCDRGACTWDGKFVLPNGHVMLTASQYDGQLPEVVHAGTSVSALYTGSSGLVFPANGSDLWISLLVAMVLSLLGLYWSVRRYVAAYFRRRREQEQEQDLITAPRH